jgi:hypothetical protein
MSPLQTTDLERQLEAGLHRRAAGATIPGLDVGRAAVGQRVERRAHRRRVGRTVAVVGLSLAVLGAGLAWARRGGSGGTVTSGTEVPAVHLPIYTSRTPGARMGIVAYRPGWAVEEVLHLPDLPPGQVYDLGTAPDAAVHLKVPTGPGQTMRVTVLGHAAIAFALPSAEPEVGLVWNPAPGVTALMTSGGLSANGSGPGETTTTKPPTLDTGLATKLVAAANQLVPADARRQEQLLDAGLGRLGPTARLSLSTAGSAAELLELVPTEVVSQMLEDAHLLPEPVALDTSLATDRREIWPAFGRAIRLRGHPAQQRAITLSVAVGALQPGRYEVITWTEHGLQLELMYRTGPTLAQVERFADALAPVSAARWHELVFPSVLDTALVPMPTDAFGGLVGQAQRQSFSSHGTAIATTTTASGH